LLFFCHLDVGWEAEAAGEDVFVYWAFIAAGGSGEIAFRAADEMGCIPNRGALRGGNKIVLGESLASSSRRMQDSQKFGRASSRYGFMERGAPAAAKPSLYLLYIAALAARCRL
jgi:hypothetical protein